MNNQERFVNFIKERYAITVKRNAGKPKPWTDDPILQQYRFCNVHREDDKVTKWVASNWRNHDDPDVWFAMVVARHINRPEALEHLGYPVPWNKRHFYKVIKERQAKELKIYNAAYMIVPRQTSMPKDEYLAERMFEPMWKDRKDLRPRKGESLQSFYERLSQFWGMGTFMSAQVIADLKYVEPLKKASDWWTFAKSGPGSRRGLNRVMGRPVKAAWSEGVWHDTLLDLQADVKSELKKVPPLHAQDLQNACCEFDKYLRVKLGEGVPKQRYNGGV